MEENVDWWVVVIIALVLLATILPGKFMEPEQTALQRELAAMNEDY